MPSLQLAHPRPDTAVVTSTGRTNSMRRTTGWSRTCITVEEIGADNDCRVAVLTGARRGFCSALDLTDPFPSAAAGLHAALHGENRSQILASTSGEVQEASEAFRLRRQ